MAHEIRTSEVKVLYGETASIAGLDGDPRPELIAEVQAAQKRVDADAACIHDQSPKAFARRRPIILGLLEEIRNDFGDNHPFYRKRLRDAQNGGYLPKPVEFSGPSERFRNLNDIPKKAAG